ncbi:hypothetical protein Golob_020938 [Gossypium lobatum]|uniref:Uncharacterized protein n=1 Tax=Gossypium lobatum TaxID=34289 RepID=A0A7J8LBY8_9ROSI|nr:hypothetical protein [Gossypium lobatum]
MLENILPHAMLKAKPNLELRIRTAQTTAYIVEEIDAENVTTANNLEERNNYRGYEDDFPWMRWMSLLHNRNR